MNDNTKTPKESTDDILAKRKPEDWKVATGFNNIQSQLDEMTRWYLLQHHDFVEVAQKNDPALAGKPISEAKEELLSYPWVAAIAAHEVAHHLYKEGGQSGKVIARRLAEAAHTRSGIDIHPGTTIGENCFIDHGTGDVIGETATIGNNTLIYHGVTLGAYGGRVDPEHRHPEIGNNNIISVGVKILGNVKVGDNVTICPNTIICGNAVVVGNDVKIKTGVRIMNGNEIADGVKIGDGAIIPENIGLIDKDVPNDCYVSRGDDGKLKTLSIAGNDNLFQKLLKKIEQITGKIDKETFALS